MYTSLCAVGVFGTCNMSGPIKIQRFLKYRSTMVYQAVCSSSFTQSRTLLIMHRDTLLPNDHHQMLIVQNIMVMR